MSKNKKPVLQNKKLGKLKVSAKQIHANPFRTFCVRRFTVFWVQQNGQNFNTSGFGARLFVGNVNIRTAIFNRHGQVCFRRLFFPTQQTLTIVTFRLSDGQIFRTRTIPAFTSSFAIIG